MKNQAIFLFLFFVISFNGFAVSTSMLDSVGVTVEKGQKYIIHEVDAGETLYALSRKYGVQVKLIKDANGASVSRLAIGQKVLIPVPDISGTEGGKIHTVSASETLYSISRLYNVQVDDLKRWNDLTENSIAVGQKLVIRQDADTPQGVVKDLSGNAGNTHTVEQSETLYSISRRYNLTTDQLVEWNNLTSNSLRIGQVLIVSKGEPAIDSESSSNSSMLPRASEQTLETTTSRPVEESQPRGAAVAVNVIPDIPEKKPEEDMLDEDVIERPVEKVIEKGMAEVIESTSDTKKYLALHRQAPVGTIMQVKNEMNGQSVFVRIVGSIQDTGDNSKVLLMISKKAYDRLGAIDRRFPVQISYIP